MPSDFELLDSADPAHWHGVLREPLVDARQGLSGDARNAAGWAISILGEGATWARAPPGLVRLQGLGASGAWASLGPGPP